MMFRLSLYLMRKLSTKRILSLTRTLSLMRRLSLTRTLSLMRRLSMTRTVSIQLRLSWITTESRTETLSGLVELLSESPHAARIEANARPASTFMIFDFIYITPSLSRLKVYRLVCIQIYFINLTTSRSGSRLFYIQNNLIITPKSGFSYCFLYYNV